MTSVRSHSFQTSSCQITKVNRAECPTIGWERGCFRSILRSQVAFIRVSDSGGSTMSRNFLFTLAAVLCVAPLVAQDAPPANSNSSAMRPAHRGGDSCLQQAGLESSVVEKIRAIGRDTRSQVEGVCSNASLTPQQQNQQVREIREKAMQERAALMTADQQKAVSACQQARHGYHPARSGAHEGHLGGCGEMPRGGSRPSPAVNGAPSNAAQPPSQPSANQSSPQN